MTFFKNIGTMGDLSLKRTLFEFEGVPILFVCTNKHNELFLCLCTDSFMDIKWMITKVTPSILLDLIMDKISIYDGFRQSNNSVFLLRKEKKGYSYKKYDFREIPEEELPDENEKLENTCLDDFISELIMMDAFNRAVAKRDFVMRSDSVTGYKKKPSEKKSYNQSIIIKKQYDSFYEQLILDTFVKQKNDSGKSLDLSIVTNGRKLLWETNSNQYNYDESNVNPVVLSMKI